MKTGDDNHIKGFILHKLFIQGYFCGRKGGVNQHILEANVPKGYDPKFRGQFKPIIKKLKKEGLISRPRMKAGKGTDWHICLVFPRRQDCRPLINAYRRSVGLKPLNERFEEE